MRMLLPSRRAGLRALLCGLLLTGLAARAQPAAAPTRPSTAGPGVQVLAPPLAMPGLQRQRTLRVYLPPAYSSEPQRRFAVLYMHDGQNLFDDATAYAGEWGVDETLDALARSHGLQVIVVGVDNGGDKRMTELNPWDHARFGKAEGPAYLDFVVGTVKPFIDAHFRTLADRGHTAIMGSSMGGLMSHYAIHRYPQVFGMAGVFSPSYPVAPEVFAYTREHPLAHNARLYLLAGGREGGGMAQGLHQMDDLLESQKQDGVQISAKINLEGRHNEAFWRAEFAQAVLWLFAAQDRPAP
jgi:predicted alpha/beta superfamily hydrolase